jgi:uncharacterized protein YfdQ (DUF2303 family)
VIPEGFKLEDLERMMPSPARTRGITKLRDTNSFIQFVKGVVQDDADGIAIYGTMDKPSFTAIFNHNGWRDWRAVYDCPLSREWDTWLGTSGRQMSQADFARFIEDNLPDVANPPAAEMLEISRSLEAKKKVNFASGIRLSNGQNELTYEEEISGTAAKGKLQVPETFTIGIPVLDGGERYAVEARLRYRIAEGGKLTMWYDLNRPHKILEDAVKAVWDKIAGETALPMYHGIPAQ